MSEQSALRTLQTLTQFVLDGVLTGNAALIPPVVSLMESLKGIIRELPLRAIAKVDILARLDQAEAALRNPALGLTTAASFSAALQILQVVTLKIQNLGFTLLTC